MHEQPMPSRAAVRGHPVHPMLVPLPITLVLTALAADIGYWVTDDREWALGAAWLLGGAVVGGVAAGVTGAVDFFGLRLSDHPAAVRHGVGNAVVLALSVVNLVLRLGDADGAVLPWGLILSVVASAVLGYTGWLGGQLSYKHMIGVDPQMDEPGTPIVGRRQGLGGAR